MAYSRRDFIKNSAVLGIGFAGLRLQACATSGVSSGTAAQQALSDGVGYGPLVRDKRGVLDLPEGFSYRIISRAGDTMSDGLFVPGAADGMGTFTAPDGKVIIVRNHELSATAGDRGPFVGDVGESGIDPNDFYDYGSGRMPALGGTTTLVYDETTGRVVTQFASLLGTMRNCAGGVTPWGSWLTCEEDTTTKGSHDGAMQVDHGYVFEVPATTDPTLARPTPIVEMGRFNHEAVAVDPNSGIVYQTEDRSDGLIYRYVPNVRERLREGGQLQALGIRGSRSFDTRNWPDNGRPAMQMNEAYEVEWIDIDNVTSPNDDLRIQGSSRGAAVFARGEGMWYGDGEVYFACTNGGRGKNGQLFKLTPSENGDVLELFIEPNDSDIMKYCDNLTIAPWGDVMLCEDDIDPYLRGVTPSGEVFTFGHNVGHRSEFAGICFSPSGQTMFVNIQVAGLTLAITGPWKSI